MAKADRANNKQPPESKEFLEFEFLRRLCMVLFVFGSFLLICGMTSEDRMPFVGASIIWGVGTMNFLGWLFVRRRMK